MVTLVPLDVFGKIFPGSMPVIASILGVTLGALWLTTVGTSVIDSLDDNIWAIPSFTFICLLMVTWYNPIQYTAQMVSLTIATYVIHNLNSINKLLLVFLLLILPATHFQTCIILGSILLTETFMRNERSKIARRGCLVLGLSFVYWNMTISRTSFLGQFPGNLEQIISIPLLIIPIILVLTISLIFESKFGIRDIDFNQDKNEVSYLSIIIGCLLVFPLMFFIDIRMGGARLVPRLMVFCFAPFAYWLAVMLERSFKLTIENLLNKRIQIIVLIPCQYFLAYCLGSHILTIRLEH